MMSLLLRIWWRHLIDVVPLFGYYPQPMKSSLIVKKDYEQRAKEVFEDTAIQISTKGERHLEAVIGSVEFKEAYCKKLSEKWAEEINLLSDIATTQPQAAYACFTSGYQHKFSYFLRTIPGIEQFLIPVEQAIQHQLIPAITGGHVVSDEERILPSRLGGLGIKDVTEEAPIKYQNSKQLTATLRKDLQNDEVQEDGKTTLQVKNKRRQQNNAKHVQLQHNMSTEAK